MYVYSDADRTSFTPELLAAAVMRAQYSSETCSLYDGATVHDLVVVQHDCMANTRTPYSKLELDSTLVAVDCC